MNITDLIGVLLVVVALVSAGGLCYLAMEYSKISESLVSAEADISSVRFTVNSATGEVMVTVSVTLDNPSDLDIEIYRIEYQAFVDKSTTSIYEIDRFVGSGSTNEKNGTVQSNSISEVQVSHVILPDSLYMERLNYARQEGDTIWTFVGGFLWFRISDYPEVSGKLPIGYFNQVVIHYV